MNKIRVLVCDDSALMRRTLKQIIESEWDMEVVGTARDGEDSIRKARELHPDVVTMDVHMPKMDGITALQVITHEAIAPVIMVSYYTQEGAEATFEALALGALDYVPKPEGTISDLRPVKLEIVEKIRAAARPGLMKKLAMKRAGSQKGKKPAASQKRPGLTLSQLVGFKAVAIGVSTGGPQTLFEVLPYLPADLPAAVFLVQHMPPQFIPTFAQRIDSKCAMRCTVAEAGMEVEPGVIYLAKGGVHLVLYRKLTGKIMIRNPKKPATAFIPSVNVMMTSVLDIFGKDTIGVLMTGMGDDGADAMVNITIAGGVTIAENEESAVVFGMSREAIERGGAKYAVPSWVLAEHIVKAVTQR
jgi:two-component system chemotaxis response regulator CheB